MGRNRLQASLRAGLDDEGITFTFDLASAVVAELQTRGMPAAELESYLHMAVDSVDVWGTSLRAKSAQAAAEARRVDAPAAFSLLEAAAHETAQYAGYAVTAVLGLIDRCYELGEPQRAAAPAWGWDGNTLLDMAARAAKRVYDPKFACERQELVQRHREWAQEPLPDAARVQSAFAPSPTRTRAARTSAISPPAAPARRR